MQPVTSGALGPMAAPADAALVTELHELHGAALFDFARHLGLSDEQAADAVQDTLLGLWRALQAGTSISQPLGWAYRTCFVVFVSGECASWRRCPRTLSVVHADGRQETIFPPADAGPVVISDFAWSLDGEQLAFTVDPQAGGSPLKHGLYVMRSDGGDLRLVMKLSASEGTCNENELGAYLRWAPDRKAIVGCFDLHEESPSAVTHTLLTVIDVASGKTRVLADAFDHYGEFFGPYHWSPNSEWVAYRTQRSGNALWVVRRDGSDRQRLAAPARPSPGRTVVADFAWSPASDAIAFAEDPAGAAVIGVVGLDGGRFEVTPRERPAMRAIEVLAWDRPDELTYRAVGLQGRVIVATTSVHGTGGDVLLDWDQNEAPSWDYPYTPWVSSDRRAVQWWELRKSGRCLMEAEGGGTRPQFCTDSEWASPLAVGEHW